MWFALVSRRGGADESLRPIQTVAGARALFGPIFWRPALPPSPPIPLHPLLTPHQPIYPLESQVPHFGGGGRDS